MQGLTGRDKCAECGATLNVSSVSLQTNRFECPECSTEQPVDYQKVVYEESERPSSRAEGSNDPEPLPLTYKDVIDQRAETVSAEREINSSEQATKSLNGLGGWLWFWTIGFFFVLIGNAISLVILFREGDWAGYTIFGALTVLNAYFAWLYFKKKRLFPGMAITYAVVSSTIGCLLIVLGHLGTPYFQPQRYPLLAFAICIADVAIWVPYFLCSKRVQATFVND